MILGTTLWQLLAGRPPFRTADDVSAPAVMQRIDRDLLPSLGRPDLPPGLEALLRAMTAKNPAERPAATDVAHHAAGIAHPAGLPLEVALPVAQRTTLPPRTDEPVRPLSSTSTVLGPVPTGPPAEPASASEPQHPASGRIKPTQEEKARRRRLWRRLTGAVLVLLLIAFGAGAYLGWHYLPPRQVASPVVTAPPSPAPSSAAPVAAGPSSPAPASPTQPKIALTLLCNLKTPTTCAGHGFSQSYKSEVSTLAGQTLYDGCFDYMTVTGPNGVVQQDSFGCNTGNPIYLNQSRPLPDGQYRIDERVQTQDGQSAQASLTFSVRT